MPTDPTDPTAEERVRDVTRITVRAGLLGTDEVHAEVVEAITAELPHRAAEADELADQWVGEAREQLRVDQEGWPEATDYERLQTAFDELELFDVDVLQACEDREAAARLLDDRAASGDSPRGLAWFTRAEVWHAVDEGTLAITLWPGAPGDAASDEGLVDDVLGVLEKHGLAAHADDGRIEVDVHWHKRISL